MIKISLLAIILDSTIATDLNASPFVWRKREIKGAQLQNAILN
jgi:hypothetical protein